MPTYHEGKPLYGWLLNAAGTAPARVSEPNTLTQPAVSIKLAERKRASVYAELQEEKIAKPAAAPTPAPQSRKEKLTALFDVLETVPENSPEYKKADQELDRLLLP